MTRREGAYNTEWFEVCNADCLECGKHVAILQYRYPVTGPKGDSMKLFWEEHRCSQSLKDIPEELAERIKTMRELAK